MQSPLSFSVQAYNLLKERIIAIHGLEEGEEALLDTMEGESDLPKLIASVLRKSREDGAVVKALDDLIEGMKARKARIETRADKLRQAARDAMQEAGLPKVMAPDFSASVSLRASAPLIDDALLPDDFRMAVITYKSDRGAINCALENGATIPGVTVRNPQPILTIRGK